MAQENSARADRRTFLAGDTFPAYAVLAIMTAGTDAPYAYAWITSTSAFIGIAQKAASVTGEAIEVILAGPTVKCIANASISAGAIVGPATAAAGRVMERALTGTQTVYTHVIGVAMENFGSATGTVGEVLLQPAPITLS